MLGWIEGRVGLGKPSVADGMCGYGLGAKQMQ